MVGKADHSEAGRFKPDGTFLIIFDLIGVAFAINLNDEARFVAVEIQDEAIKGVLAPEFVAIELFATQTLPETSFWLGGFATHFAGALEDSWMGGGV